MFYLLCSFNVFIGCGSEYEKGTDSLVFFFSLLCRCRTVIALMTVFFSVLIMPVLHLTQGFARQTRKENNKWPTIINKMNGIITIYTTNPNNYGRRLLLNHNSWMLWGKSISNLSIKLDLQGILRDKTQSVKGKIFSLSLLTQFNLLSF